MGLFSKLKEGLTKTRDNIVSGIDNIFNGFSSIDDDFYEELEETLIMGDIGVRATDEIIEDLKAKVKENKIKDPKDLKVSVSHSDIPEDDTPRDTYSNLHRKKILLSEAHSHSCRIHTDTSERSYRYSCVQP